MSVRYIPVQWNRTKWIYDAVMLAAVGGLLWVFLYVTPDLLAHEKPVSGPIHTARAFGVCAFLMLTVILCMGPLARLDRRFLPLLYNRRHFGVMTLFVAITHAASVLNWYFAFSPLGKYEALLSANDSYGQLAGFPFEVFGMAGLFVLAVMATTSHDFWMKFLTPRLWKSLHYLVYPAYAAIVAHISLGVLQDTQNQTLAWMTGAAAGVVILLHLAAALRELRAGDPATDVRGDWEAVCRVDEISEGLARVARLANGDRVAVFRQAGKLSAIANACAHQNGPLGEGRVIDCLVTCPWHGFQYNVTDGRSPAPFTEMVPTYRLKLSDGIVLVDPMANPPGTYVEPVIVTTAASQERPA